MPNDLQQQLTRETKQHKTTTHTPRAPMHRRRAWGTEWTLTVAALGTRRLPSRQLGGQVSEAWRLQSHICSPPGHVEQARLDRILEELGAQGEHFAERVGHEVCEGAKQGRTAHNHCSD